MRAVCPSLPLTQRQKAWKWRWRRKGGWRWCSYDSGREWGRQRNKNKDESSLALLLSEGLWLLHSGAVVLLLGEGLWLLHGGDVMLLLDEGL